MDSGYIIPASAPSPHGPLPAKNPGADTHACPYANPPSSPEPHPAVPSDPKPGVEKAASEAAWGCRPDPAPASPQRPGQGVYPTLAPRQGQVPREILAGHGDDSHPALCTSKHFSRRDPGRSWLAQGVPGTGGTGAAWAPGGQEDASFSGPHSDPGLLRAPSWKIPRAHSETQAAQASDACDAALPGAGAVRASMTTSTPPQPSSHQGFCP